MLINMCLFNARHPHRFIPANTNVRLAEDGLSEAIDDPQDRRGPLAWGILFFSPMEWLQARSEGKEKRHLWRTVLSCDCGLVESCIRIWTPAKVIDHPKLGLLFRLD
jgi:hypothetical protein